MQPNAELAVQLRLLMDKVSSDAKKAAQTVNKSFAANLVKSDSLNKLIWWNKAVLKGTQDIGKAAKQVTAELDKWRKANVGGIIAGQKISIAATPTGARTAFGQRTQQILQAAAKAFGGGGTATSPSALDVVPTIGKQMDAHVQLYKWVQKTNQLQLRAQQDQLKFWKDMSLIMLPLLKPGSVWGTAFASRGISSGLLGTAMGRSTMAKLGLSGASGAALLSTGLVAAATAAGAALAALAYVVKDLTIKAIDNARRIYSKSITSGLGLGFVTRRTMLSEVIGVDEKEVIRFGFALQWIGDKLNVAQNEIQKNVTVLTAVSWNFKILKFNLLALGSQIAEALAPAINRIITVLNAVIKLDIMAGKGKLLGVVLGAVIDSFARLIAITQIVDSTFVALMVTIADGIKNLVAEVTNLLAKLHVPGFTKSALPVGDNKQAWKSVGEIIRAAIGVTGAFKEEVPQPSAFMRQLPADTLGRMGLVMGFGNVNPAHETAKNTKETVKILKDIHKGLLKGSNPMTFNPAQSYP